MLYKNKTELKNSARNVANQLAEFMEYAMVSPNGMAQEILQSADWVHVYNLLQRSSFVNYKDVHAAFVFELPMVLEEEYSILSNVRPTADGFEITFAGERIEIYCLDKALEGIKLNMPL